MRAALRTADDASCIHQREAPMQLSYTHLFLSSIRAWVSYRGGLGRPQFFPTLTVVQPLSNYAVAEGGIRESAPVNLASRWVLSPI